MSVLIKLKGNVKAVPSKFCPESKELPRIGKPVKGNSKLFPYVFSQKPLALHFLPLPQSHSHKGKQHMGREIPFISREAQQSYCRGGRGLAGCWGPWGPHPKVSLRTGSLPGRGGAPKADCGSWTLTLCLYAWGPGRTPSLSPQ